MKKFDLALIVLALAFTSASAAPVTFSQNQTQTVVSPSSAWRWEWNDDGWRRRVEIHGKASFNEDYSDVTGLSEGGVVRIEEDDHGNLRLLEVRRSQEGLIRKYYVNGEARAFDQNGNKWVAGLLLLAVRQGAIDAENRVKTILRRGGVHAMLEEISSITGDYAKRIYFETLVKNESLDRNDLQKIADALKTQIVSDHEKANLLKRTADRFLDSSLSAAFFQAVSSITSDYERRLTLSDVLKRRDLNEQALVQMLDCATGISSDYEKANFFLAASSLYTGDLRLRSAFLKAVETIKSDH
ncbi:MAG TPA: hypothetical protein VJS64_04960, partial [Pyrinomonadaceae bacterium]|nr:hypothetical protein [Pyrinomonadaceae bacterium]